MPEISIKAETLFHINGFAVKNSMVLSTLVFLALLLLGLFYYKESKKEIKSGLFYTVHLILRTLYDLFYSIVHDKIEVFFPLLSALFIWILVQNWSGLFPGVGSVWVGIHEGAKLKHIPLLRGNNADLSATLALALVSMTMVQVYGIRFLGFGAYLHKFINLSSPIDFFVGILDIVSEFSKILSFAFRLFGNIFAGEVLMTIVAFLIPVLASFPFLILEIFVGFVQALVFSMLTSVLFNMAVSKH